MVVSLIIAAIALPWSQDTVTLTLETATRRAIDVSPLVAATTASIRGPRGLQAEARWPVPDNPILEIGRIRRSTIVAATSDREWAITQDVEIGGQWLLRGSRASALIQAAEARTTDAQRLAALGARRAWVALAIAERRSALTDSAARFAEGLAGFAQRQADAGEINRLELNAAVLEGARARSAAERVRSDLAAASVELARWLALPADTVPRTEDLPDVPSLWWPSDEQLVARAIHRRHDLRAAESTRLGTERAVMLAQRARMPLLSLSFVGGREADTDKLRGFILGVKIPLLYRQQATLGAAEAERAAAQSDEIALQRVIRAEVLAAGARFRRAREAERRFATGVLSVASENVALTERALAEGEVSLTDVIVLRSSAVSAQLEYLEVLQAALDAWLELAAALSSELAELPRLLETQN